MTEAKKKPSLAAIFTDLAVGAGAKILLAKAFPGADIWGDWAPWDETPVEEYLESLPPETGPISSLLSTRLPPVSPQIPMRDFLIPIVGLGRVFGFRASALAKMIDVDLGVLREWLTEAVVPAGEDRQKVALLAALYVQLANRFDGKPVKLFYEWMATPVAGLGGRCPDQALLDGHSLAVVNYLAVAALREKAK